MSVTASLLCFWCFAAVLLPGIDVYYYYLAWIIEKYNRLFTTCIAKTGLELNVCVPLQKSVTVFVFIHFLVHVCLNRQGNLAFKTARVENTFNTSDYSVLGWGKQLFNFICGYKHTKKKLPSFRSCRAYI